MKNGVLSILLVEDERGFGVQLFSELAKATENFRALGVLRPGQKPFTATIVNLTWKDGKVSSTAETKEVTGDLPAGPGEWKIGAPKK